MIKVQLLSDTDGHNFTTIVNSFVRDKQVIDIKYQAVIGSSNKGPAVCDRALIIYEEVENND